jgi:tetratricopeptide (TPR) repeat protein
MTNTALMQEAKNHLNSGNISRAIECCNQAYSRSHDDIFSVLNRRFLGNCFLKLGQLNQALEAYDQALALHSRVNIIKLRLFELEHVKGSLLQKKGNLFFAKGNFKEASINYHKALECFQSHSDTSRVQEVKKEIESLGIVITYFIFYAYSKTYFENA